MMGGLGLVSALLAFTLGSLADAKQVNTQYSYFFIVEECKDQKFLPFLLRSLESSTMLAGMSA